MTDMETRLRAIIDAAPFGAHSYELHDDGRLVFLGGNKSADRILSLDHSTLVGKTIEDAFPGLNGTQVPDAYRNVAATGEPFNYDQVLYDRNEIRGAFEIHAFQTLPQHMTVFFRDITEKKKMEIALQESERRFRQVVQDANAILFIIDSKGIFRMSEGRALARIGLRPGQIVGMSALEVYKDNPTVIGALTAALEGRLTRAESIVNGIHFDAIYSPTFDQDGRQNGVIGLAIDISERVRAEEEVRTLNRELDQRVKDRTAQLEAANAELESFSYSVSHDLRAPLRGIDGWAEVFLEECGGSLDDTGRSYLDRIRRETKQMGRLIDDLLRLSRLSCKEIDVQPIDLSAMAERIAASHREREPERDVVWHIRPALMAHGDPALIEVALTNLIGNAWKFSAKKPQASIEIGRDDGSDGAPFFVRDNGAGFDMAYAGKLFGAFQRMHNQTEFPGSGIGLATVKRIIARHGGRIWADAHPGAGATFYFTLEAPPASLRMPSGGQDRRDMIGT